MPTRSLDEQQVVTSGNDILLEAEAGVEGLPAVIDWLHGVHQLHFQATIMR